MHRPLRSRRAGRTIGRLLPAALLGLIAALPGPGLAQTAVGDLAEEIAVVRAVKAIQLTRAQLAPLATAVAAAGEYLTKQSLNDTRSLAALRDPALRARQQVLPAGVNLNDPNLAPALAVEPQLTRAQRTAQQNLSRAREEQVTALRRQFQALLGAQQIGIVLAQGRSLVAAERLGRDQQQALRRQQFQQAAPGRGGAAGGTGTGARDEGDRSQRMLDRLREADADQYQRMSQGMARRYGDEGTPAYRNALSQMDRIRNMPSRQFNRQRSDLSRQLTNLRNAPAVGANPALTISDDNAIETWIERYLLSPRSPAALKSLSADKPE